jgi:hypothetical protein
VRRLRAARRQLGQTITARLVSPFTLSRLDYCHALLAELLASNLAPLQRTMHAAVRIVCDLLPRDHVTSALQSLPIIERIEFNLCLLIHLAINGRASAYLKVFIKTTASVSDRAANRSASNNDLVIQQTRFKFGQRVFSVAGPRIWNQLPTDIKTTTNADLLKRKLKTFIFFTAYLQ